MDKPKIVIQMIVIKESGHVTTREMPINHKRFLALQFVMPDGQRIKISTDGTDGIQIFSTTGRIHVIPCATNAIMVRSVGFPSRPALTLDMKDGKPE